MAPGFVTDITYYLNALSITAQWRQACYPEAVHTLALKLHEMVYLSDLELFKAFFASQVAEAIAHCSPCDLWLQTKLLFQEISDVAQRPRSNHSVDFIASFCGASSHSPGGNFAAYTDNLTWLQGLLTASSQAQRVRLFIMEKCAHKASPADREVRYNELTDAVKNLVTEIKIVVVEEELRADDCTAYLKYISAYYDDLADFMFFIHPDIEEHAMMPLVQRVITATLTGVLLPNELPFLYLSHNYLDLAPERNNLWETYAVANLWKKIFSSVLPHRSQIKAYCCSQFMVTRGRVKLRSQNFYFNALRVFESAESYKQLSPFNVVTPRYDLICRTPCQLNMPWWHIYFGEPLTYTKISNRTDTPLFIRLLVSDHY